jgi:HEAT repeat protein
LVREVSAPNATVTLAALLHRVDAPMQIALLEGLAQRGDYVASSTIAVMDRSRSPEVRVAAIQALAILGDSTLIPLLGVAAISTNSLEQNAARLALVQLRRGEPTECLLRLLPNAKPEVQAEFARALGDRTDRAAIPTLVELVKEGRASARKAALQALALLVDDPQLGMMVQFVRDSATDAERADAAEALNSACHNILPRRGKVNVDPLIQPLANASTATRIALLPICSGLTDPKLRAALREALLSEETAIHTAAVRALCGTSDPQLLPDLLSAACQAPEENLRTVAIRACVRLATQDEAAKLPVKDQLETLKQILATKLNLDQKRVVLAGLAEIADLEALKLAEPMLDEAAIQPEASKAVCKIASALPYAQGPAAKPALTKVFTTSTDPETKKAAESALKEIDAGADYIVAWQAAGPYFQAGKEYKDLFDMPFPPETDKAEGVKWQTLPLGPDPKRPWVMDLLKPFGGLERVAYARTWVHCDKEQPARLELGTDDGVKVWFNNAVVHTNNTFRGLQPGSDKVDLTLKAGWSPLLLKITQLNAGWEFCARFVKPDGSRLEGLQFDIAPKEPAPAAAAPAAAASAVAAPAAPAAAAPTPATAAPATPAPAAAASPATPAAATVTPAAPAPAAPAPAAPAPAPAAK